MTQPVSHNVALATALTGQNGDCLPEVLLNKGYEVHGIKRPMSLFDTGTIAPTVAEFVETAT